MYQSDSDNELEKQIDDQMQAYFSRNNLIKAYQSNDANKIINVFPRIKIEELFDAGDEVYTRVVETASLVFKIAKSGPKTTEKMDQAGYIAELEKLSGLAVKELKTLKDKYISSVTAKVTPKVLAPTEKNESIVREGVMEKITQFVSLASNKVKSFLGKWDNQFAPLKAKIESELV